MSKRWPHWVRRCKVAVANTVLRTSQVVLGGSQLLDDASRRLYRCGYWLSEWAFRKPTDEEGAP